MKEESPCEGVSQENLSEHYQRCRNAELKTLAERSEVDLLHPNDSSDKVVSSSANDFPGLFTNEGTSCVIESYESIFDQCHSKPKLKQREYYMTEKLINVKQEPELDIYLADKSLASFCIDGDNSDVESHERRHIIAKPEHLDNDGLVEKVC